MSENNIISFKTEIAIENSLRQELEKKNVQLSNSHLMEDDGKWKS